MRYIEPYCDQNGLKKVPTGSPKGNQKGARREPREPKWSPKDAKRDPKESQNEPRGPQEDPLRKSTDF